MDNDKLCGGAELKGFDFNGYRFSQILFALMRNTLIGNMFRN
jgi:hypothetical protein